MFRWKVAIIAVLAVSTAALGAEQTAKKKADKKPKKPEPTIKAPVRDSEHQFSLAVPNYLAIKRRNIVMQKRDYSCGAAALATICRYYWEDNVTEDQILGELDDMLTDEEIKDRIENGLAMSDLRRAAVRLGYQAVVGKTTFEKLSGLKVPVIVGIEPEGHKHFVVYRGVDPQYVYVADPIRGNIRIPIWEFRPQWQQNAVLVVHKPGSKVKTVSPLSLREEDVNIFDGIEQIVRSQESRQPAQNSGVPR